MSGYPALFLLLLLPGVILPNVTRDDVTSRDLLSALSHLAEGATTTPFPYPITNWCYAWLQQFAVVTSEFVQCTVQNARPFTFCRHCAEEYLKASNFVTDLIAQDDKLSADRKCFPRLVNSDVINIVGKVQDFISHMWSDSCCDMCYDHFDLQNGTIEFELSNYTSTYLELFNKTTVCLNAFIKYANATAQYDEFACQYCQDDYVALNKLYAVIQRAGSVCMDVTDAMNYTRFLWSKDFQCNYQVLNPAQVLGTCAAIFTLPIFFYVISKFQGAIRKKRLLKLKRLKFKRPSGLNTSSLRSSYFGTFMGGESSSGHSINRRPELNAGASNAVGSYRSSSAGPSIKSSSDAGPSTSSGAGPSRSSGSGYGSSVLGSDDARRLNITPTVVDDSLESPHLDSGST